MTQSEVMFNRASTFAPWPGKLLSNVNPINIFLRFLIVAALVMTGCQHLPRHAEARQAPWQVHRAAQPIQIDGKLDEADWQKAPPIALGLPQPEQAKGRTLEEAGTARLLYDDHNLYVAFELEDADLVAEEQTGEPHLLRLGDVVEVFLKPVDPLWYWEFHVNPVGKTLTYGYPGRGRLGLPSTIGIPAFIRAAANSTVGGDISRFDFFSETELQFEKVNTDTDACLVHEDRDLDLVAYCLSVRSIDRSLLQVQAIASR